jgi:hypothetical protein
MADTLEIIIDTDGTVRHIADPRAEFLASEGQVERRRASHVVPLHPVKRAAFVLIRALVPDTGRMAAWTRMWRGPWIADMSPFGPEGRGVALGPFNERFAAIAAEREWLKERL